MGEERGRLRQGGKRGGGAGSDNKAGSALKSPGLAKEGGGPGKKMYGIH